MAVAADEISTEQLRRFNRDIRMLARPTAHA